MKNNSKYSEKLTPKEKMVEKITITFCFIVISGIFLKVVFL